MGIAETAYRYAIKNAFLHEGKASLGAVVGKVMALHQTDPVSAMPAIKEAVEKVNAMEMEAIRAEYARLEGTYELRPKEKEEGLPNLEWAADEAVVTRFAPNPSGRMHLGHARVAIPSYDYARTYKGKFILRFDDTDPKIKVPLKEAESAFVKDLNWLGITQIDQTVRASDRLERYDAVIENLLEMEKAYVCTCQSEEWRSLTKSKQACPCRELAQDEQRARWEKMQKHEYKEGQAVLRLKTDLNHKDPSQRDWWLARIVDDPQHPNPKAKKRHVWPSYNLASATDDHELAVTLIIRGQEHAQNATKQKFLYEYMGWRYPHAVHTGRVKLEGVLTSKSKIAAAIEKGELSGPDDPRIGTIEMLKKRGFDPKAVLDIILNLGLNTHDATISVDALYDANRARIDPESDRLTFIRNPVPVTVSLGPGKEARIPVHPDDEGKGEKVYGLTEGSQDFLVEKKDVGKLVKGDVLRLRNAYNARLTGKEEGAVFAQYSGDGKIKNTFHWLLPKHAVDAEIVMPDAEEITGKTEEYAFEKKPGDIVLFEKLGYARLYEVDTEKRVVRAYFAHR